MATMNRPADDLEISVGADNLLSHLSDDFADLILAIASHHATPTPDGGRVVNENSVKAAIARLCEVLDEGVKSGSLPSGTSSYATELRRFCETVAASTSSSGL